MMEAWLSRRRGRSTIQDLIPVIYCWVLFGEMKVALLPQMEYNYKELAGDPRFNGRTSGIPRLIWLTLNQCLLTFLPVYRTSPFPLHKVFCNEDYTALVAKVSAIQSRSMRTAHQQDFGYARYRCYPERLREQAVLTRIV